MVAKTAGGTHAVEVLQGGHAAHLAHQMQAVAEQIAEFYAIAESEGVISYLLTVSQEIAGGAG